MISDIKHNIQARLPLPEAIKTSMRSRIRPVVMTAAMAATGLMPAAMSHGIGSESQRPVGNRHYRRIDRRYFLCPVHLPADCGDGLQEDAV